MKKQKTILVVDDEEKIESVKKKGRLACHRGWQWAAVSFCVELAWQI